MTVGGMTIIAFEFYEAYAGLKEPLLPVHLFMNFAWVAS